MNRAAWLACITVLISSSAAVIAQDPPATQPAESHGWLGVRFTDLSDALAEQIGLPNANGVYILEVVPDSPAQAGKMRDADVVLRMDDTYIDNQQEMRRTMRTTRPGQIVRIIVFREKTEHELTVKLGSRPVQPPPPRIPRPDAVN